MILIVADGDGRAMECDQCGARAPFDEGLPYVNQTASFATGHDCPVVGRSVRPDDAL